MTTCFIAIDPGVKIGYAYCLYDTITKSWQLAGNGVVKEIKIRRALSRRKSVMDANQVVALFNDLVCQHKEVVCIIEDVHPMPKQGVVSTSNLMRAIGTIEGICLTLKIPRYYVSPSAWKKKMGVTADKATSLHKVQSLFPQVKFEDHNDAEAALMLHYFLHHKYVDKDDLC